MHCLELLHQISADMAPRDDEGQARLHRHHVTVTDAPA